MQQSRIVSLIASATEIVCALGLRDNLVGRSHECDFPLDVKGLPQCTEPKFSPDGTSFEIDQRVRSVLRDALSVYNVHANMLDDLEPTHIITQSQCEVCAVSLADVEAAACEMFKSQPKIISLEPNQLSDVWHDIETVATGLNAADRGKMLIAEMQQRMAEIASEAPRERVTVAYIEWIDPLMAGGNWMPELIERAGAINLFGVAGLHSPPLTWESFVHADPDVIIVAPCGFDIARTVDEMHVLTEREEWSTLNAVQHKRVYIADGNQYFNRPGPRLVDSLEIIAEICYPKTFRFGHEITGWVPYVIGLGA